MFDDDVLVSQAVTPLCGGIACSRRPARPSGLVSHAMWRDIAILACTPPPEPSIPARSRSALAACRPCLPPDRRPSVRPSM